MYLCSIFRLLTPQSSCNLTNFFFFFLVLWQNSPHTWSINLNCCLFWSQYNSQLYTLWGLIPSSVVQPLLLAEAPSAERWKALPPPPVSGTLAHWVDVCGVMQMNSVALFPLLLAFLSLLLPYRDDSFDEFCWGMTGEILSYSDNRASICRPASLHHMET